MDKFRTLNWNAIKLELQFSGLLSLYDYDYQTTVATVVSVARRAKQIFESSEPSEKRALLNYLFQNPTVNDG